MVCAAKKETSTNRGKKLIHDPFVLWSLRVSTRGTETHGLGDQSFLDLLTEDAEDVFLFKDGNEGSLDEVLKNGYLLR
jgi:hypothetical protein